MTTERNFPIIADEFSGKRVVRQAAPKVPGRDPRGGLRRQGR